MHRLVIAERLIEEFLIDFPNSEDAEALSRIKTELHTIRSSLKETAKSPQVNSQYQERIANRLVEIATSIDGMDEHRRAGKIGKL